MPIHKIDVITNSGGYNVFIGRGLLPECGEYVRKVTTAKKVCVITDMNVRKLYLDAVYDSLERENFEVCWFAFPPGEPSKSVKNLEKIWNFLSKCRLTRSDCLIALGGGVVGDITGFAAATYLRGIDYIQMPTTLLAQVDSSVGGKTAIDLPEGKNLVGAFKQPALVLADIDTLDTLPEAFFRDGMGEVIKHGMIKSEKLFEILEQHDLESLRNDKDVLLDVIGRNVTIKRDVVQADEFDRGERMKLNFGHTLGHAIEQHYNYTGVTHGMAVAAGMKLITEIAEKHDMAEEGVAERLTRCLERYGLNTGIAPPPAELGAACLNDKKRFGSIINIIVCCDVGAAMIKKMPADAFFALLAEA